MKPTALQVNTARGAIVDEDALAAAAALAGRARFVVNGEK
ncbi:NAD(P)-dependent oxidoreductase [Amycolatopsis balhimycina]|nr:NAD(P)-dependent oxidoreductase [Amycolatopsis balhimycina]